MNVCRRRALLASMVAALAACGTQAALAQQGRGAEPMLELESVIVTARRREENLMETPVSITAITSEELRSRQIEQAHQIAESTPNLVFYNTTSVGASNIAATIFIRGVGQADSVPTVQNGVGLYVDNAYVSTSVGALTDVMDVESIEVLRGPQGTLFGRNTIGGAVLITSKKPSDKFAADLDLTVGEFARRQVKASVNVPLSDTFYAKISALSRHRDGWVSTPNIQGDDDLGSDDTWAARAAFRWVPTSDLTVDLSVDRSHHESDGVPRIVGPINENLGSVGEYNNIVAPAMGLPLYTVADVATDPKRYTSNASQLIRADADVLGINLAVEWQIGDLTVHSYTNYRDQKTYDGADIDHSPLLIQESYLENDGDQFSQEFHLSGVALDDRLNWLVGVYHFQNELLSRGPIRFPLFSIMSGAHIDNESNAIFGQLTYDLTEKWSVTLGGRYTKEEFNSIVGDDLHFSTSTFDPTCTGSCAQPTLDGFFSAVDGYRILPIPPSPGARRIVNPNVFSTDETEAEPYFNVSYNVTDELMAYVSYSQGFKGGGFTQRISPGRTVQSFSPEFAKVYELGAKWSGHRANISGAVFYTDYTDLQVPVSQQLGSSVDNAGDAVIKGAELEARVSVTQGLQVSVGAGYLDAKYTNLRSDVEFSADKWLPSVMKWKTNASIIYTLPVSALFGEFVARVDHNFTDKHYTGARNEPGTLIPSYNVFNAGVTYIHDSGTWETAVQGRNITDELYTPQRDGFLQSSGFLNYVLAPPSEWSVSFRYRF